MMKRLLCAIRICLLCVLPFQTGLFAQFASQSVLSSGKFFKVAVAESGIYRLDATFLSNVAGIDLNQTNARNITLWTNGGGMLPQKTTDPRIDDLREVAMLGIGTSDGKVDAGDYFLFYAESPDSWVFDPSDERFHQKKNIYDTRNYYFICVSERQATSIQSRASLPDAGMEISAFDAYATVNPDKVNLLGKFRPPGSGQRWFGDDYSVTRTRNYSLEFPTIVPGSDVFWTVDFAGRSDGTTSVSAEFNGNKTTKLISGVNTGNVEADFARIVRLSGSYTATEPTQNIEINYPQVGGASSGWLDFIELQATASLQYQGFPLQFRSIASAGTSTAEYLLSGATLNHVIWDITDPQRPVSQEFQLNNGRAEFVVNSDGRIREFIAFVPGKDFSTPEAVGHVPNQNLHGIVDADLVIIYHANFEQAAMRLAAHRLEHNGYLVETIPVGTIMNEFAGGGQDPTAIRDFARMLHQRSQRFRFLLLMGDGTYDMRHLNTEQSDDNFVPIFETEESLHPIKSFPSDDYFGLLSDEEGETLRGALDIAVGRIPVRTNQEANLVVDKLIRYDNSAPAFGDWRLNLTYVADDEDSNQHLLQTEDVASTQQNEHPKYNVKKIYLDAFQQVSTPGGQRYPDVNGAINKAVQDGTLVLNYFGHGGPAGWTQERVLGVSDIQSWSNQNKLPVFVTATCSFTSYDEPSLRSAGELVLVHPSGGAVALLTTVRAVYSSSNKRLTSEVFERILLEDHGAMYAIGEVMIMAKNSNHSDTVEINARKFALIGDPSMRLSIPENQVVVTTVNGLDAETTVDTASALEEVTIGGEIRNSNGQKLSQFNGIVSVTVFDKPTVTRTLANDEKSYEKDFVTQNKVLFKGTATVKDGAYEITFVIPQDISFAFGKGKVSLYATDGTMDASGYYADLVIGGGSNVSTDNAGPVINLAVDYQGFVSGGETGPNPNILIELADDSGINITGNSIGHDLVGDLSGPTEGSYILNDRYVAAVDDHTSGSVSLPLSGLEPGMHTFTVIAWDIANNFSEASIDFLVVRDPKDMIKNLRNSPNPFVDGTVFGFDHQLGNVPMSVEIEVFSTTGALVQHLEWSNVISTNGTVDNLSLTESSLNGGKLIPGAYLYRANVISHPGTSQEQHFESKFSKLIVVN